MLWNMDKSSSFLLPLTYYIRAAINSPSFASLFFCHITEHTGKHKPRQKCCYALKLATCYYFTGLIMGHFCLCMKMELTNHSPTFRLALIG